MLLKILVPKQANYFHWDWRAGNCLRKITDVFMVGWDGLPFVGGAFLIQAVSWDWPCLSLNLLCEGRAITASIISVTDLLPWIISRFAFFDHLNLYQCSFLRFSLLRHWYLVLNCVIWGSQHGKGLLANGLTHYGWHLPFTYCMFFKCKWQR